MDINRLIGKILDNSSANISINPANFRGFTLRQYREPVTVWNAKLNREEATPSRMIYSWTLEVEGNLEEEANTGKIEQDTN